MNKKTDSNLFFYFLKQLQSFFINGFLALLPLGLTVFIITFIIRTAHHWSTPLLSILPEAIRTIPFIELFSISIFFISIGIVLKFVILRWFIEKAEKIVRRLPLIKQIYFGTKQLITALNPQDKTHFQKVVLIEFPRKGIYSLGFLTCQNTSLLLSHTTSSEGAHKRFYNIFIPHTPNPTGGAFVIAPEEECIMTDLSRQDAMAIIISGGIIQPDQIGCTHT